MLLSFFYSITNFCSESIIYFVKPFLSQRIKNDAQLISNEIKKRKKTSLSASLIKCLIIAEDKRFNYHNGVDLIGIIRAIKRIIFEGKIEGASTIEQQLVRTLTRQYEIKFSRKVREIILAIYISKEFNKLEIANFYLTVAYFGWRMNGIYEVFKRMKVDSDNINLITAASIIARLKYPLPQYPSIDRMLMVKYRTNHILSKINGNYSINQQTIPIELFSET
jgi:membrane carboxypeptidase/penicillin-binding protein